MKIVVRAGEEPSQQRQRSRRLFDESVVGDRPNPRVSVHQATCPVTHGGGRGGKIRALGLGKSCRLQGTDEGDDHERTVHLSPSVSRLVALCRRRRSSRLAAPERAWQIPPPERATASTEAVAAARNHPGTSEQHVHGGGAPYCQAIRS